MVRIYLKEGPGTDRILFPDGRQFAARFAADAPGSRRFAALIPGLGPREAAALFGGVSPIAVESPAAGLRVYEGYTRLADVRPLEGGALVILERPDGGEERSGEPGEGRRLP